MMPPRPNSFLETLTSYLEGLKDAGIRELPWKGPPPSAWGVAAVTPAPPPRPAAAPALEKDPSPSVLPRAPEAEKVVCPADPAVCWLRAVLHPDCAKDSFPQGGFLLVVTDIEETQGEPGELLTEMLHAIGFQIGSSPTPFSQTPPENASRVLVMGDPALQSVSTSGMKLQIVRGLWQNASLGRMVATYAPSAVVDSPSGKRTVWGDLQLLMEDLGLELPSWTREKLKKK